MKNGAFGAFEGKLGPVVGYRWKGVPCMRAAQRYVNNPRTAVQQEHRRQFRELSRLGSDMLEVARIGFRGQASERHTTEYNCFLKANRQCVGVEDGGVSISYAGLKVADGVLDGVEFGEPAVGSDGMVSVGFGQDSGDGGDYVLLYAFEPESRQGRLSLPVLRGRQAATVALPAEWRGSGVHLYGFCWDNATTTSPSCYVGRIEL